MASSQDENHSAFFLEDFLFFLQNCLWGTRADTYTWSALFDKVVTSEQLAAIFKLKYSRQILFRGSDPCNGFSYSPLPDEISSTICEQKRRRKKVETRYEEGQEQMKTWNEK